MVGAPFSWENTFNSRDVVAETNSSRLDRYIDYSYAKYIGGHPLYTKPRDTGVYFYNDRFEVVNPNLGIPYSAITRIENMDEKKISADRVLLLGVIGAVWRKKHTYTVIQYREGGYEITVVLDFDAAINRIQTLIFNKMMEFKRK
jgi:hypothetical protein